MQLRDTFRKQRQNRFERLKIVLPILLAGWIPSVLTLVVSYTILRDTLLLTLAKSQDEKLALGSPELVQNPPRFNLASNRRRRPG